eukprot:4917180-Ditylum_brightwellii.AAC.1
MATFLKIGYLGIKRVLADNKVNYATSTIIQMLDFKEKLETATLKKGKVTLMSLDIKTIHPLVQLQLIQKALKHYTRNLPKEDKKTIETCQEMIRFGMQNTLLQYHRKYYTYK